MPCNSSGIPAWGSQFCCFGLHIFQQLAFAVICGHLFWKNSLRLIVILRIIR